MNAIIFFDDQPRIVENFKINHLTPALEVAGVTEDEIDLFYVSYLDDQGVRPVNDIAMEAYTEWSPKTCDRTVFVLDLNPDLPSLRLSAAFLQELLTALARAFGDMNTVAFVENCNFLSTVLTKFPDAFVAPQKVATIRKKRGGTMTQQVQTAMQAICKPGPRIVLATSPDHDPAWLAKVIVTWLKGG